jgi:hypothetical protein
LTFYSTVRLWEIKKNRLLVKDGKTKKAREINGEKAENKNPKELDINIGNHTLFV